MFSWHANSTKTPDVLSNGSGRVKERTAQCVDNIRSKYFTFSHIFGGMQISSRSLALPYFPPSLPTVFVSFLRSLTSWCSESELSALRYNVVGKRCFDAQQILGIAENLMIFTHFLFFGNYLCDSLSLIFSPCFCFSFNKIIVYGARPDFRGIK